MRRSLWLLVLAACADPPASPPPLAPPPRPIQVPPATDGRASYRVTFPEVQGHLIEIEGRFTTEGRATVVLMMPSWIPGSYMIREFARQIETIAAFDDTGASLPIEKTQKNRFAIQTQGHQEIVVRYRVYAREPTVRTSFVDASYALLNPSSLFLADVDRPLAYAVQIEPAPTWPQVATALPKDPAGGEHAFLASSYDELVDDPILYGTLGVERFNVDGVSFEMATLGDTGLFDDSYAAKGAAKSAAEIAAIFGEVPFARYVVLSLLELDAGGGLEHKSSTVLMIGRLLSHTEEGRLRYQGLFAHELFHAWNGKRLRPKGLGPFDYEEEVYTPSLWFVEGFTSYYDDLIVARAGLGSEAEYLKAISSEAAQLIGSYGERVQSLEQSSYDAWIKYYRSDENSPNATVSYYTKGALLAFVLDAKIRQASNHRVSLDDVMRAAYRRYSGESGYTPDELEAVVAEVAGQPIAKFMKESTTSASLLDLQPALSFYGLRMKPEPVPSPTETEVERGARLRKRTWIGAETVLREGRLYVYRVVREGPAFRAGLEYDDELIAFDDLRIGEANLDKRLELYRPGDTAKLTVSRRGRLSTVPVTFGERPKEVVIERDPGRSQAELTALLRSRVTPK